MIKTVKEYVQIYPLEQFPLLQEFHDNLHLYSNDKDEYWQLFLENSLEHGLRVICRILDKHNNGKQPFDAYVSLVGGPERDLYYVGFSCKNTEEDIEKYLGIIPLTVIPDGNVKYGSYSNYAKGKKDYTPKK